MSETGPVIVVRGAHARAGATTVVAALAHRLAYAGHPVRAARLDDGTAGATADAAALSALDFIEAPLAPLAAASLTAPDSGVLLVDAGTAAVETLAALRARATLVAVCGCDRDGALGASEIAVRTHAPAVLAPGEAAAPWSLAEDRLLAAPTVGTLAERIDARVITRSLEGERAICEHIVLGAIAADSDRPHFARFPNKAVVTRAERVDIGLSALAADTACLILTGGNDPSPYLLDRVGSGRETTLLVAPGNTVETAQALQECFGASPFSHETKAERAGALLAATVDDAALAGLLGG